MAEEVDAPCGAGELAAHVGGGVDVDDPVTAAVGAEHGEVTAAVLDDLGVDAGPAAPQRTDQLADQAVTLDATHPGDDGEPRVQRRLNEFEPAWITNRS